MRAEDFLEGGDIGSAGDFLDQPAAPAAAPAPPAIAYDPLIGADLPALPAASATIPSRPPPPAPRMLAQQPQGDIPGLGGPPPPAITLGVNPGSPQVAPAAPPPSPWTDPLSGVPVGGDISFEPPPLPNPEILDDYGNRVPLRPTSPPPPTIAQRITDWARRPAAATDPDVIRDAAPPVEAMDDYGRPFQVTPPRGLIGDRFIAPEWMSPENARRQEEWMRRNQRERTLDRRAEATMDARVEIDPRAVSRAGGWDPLSQPANQQAPDGQVTPYPASPVEFLSQIAGAVGRGTLIDAGLESLRPWEVRRDQANLFRQAIATAGREIERMPAEQVQDLVRWARMRLPERTANDFRRAVEFLRSGRMTADEFGGFLDSWMDQSNWIRYLRRNGEALIDQLLPGVNPEFQRTFLGQMARASGTTVGALLVNMLPAGGWINALSFYSQGEAQQLEDAIRAGATNDQIGRLFLQAGGTAGVGGLTELAELELLLRPVVRNPGALGFVMASARNMVRNGAAEGLQEAVQQTLQNLEAGRVYDPRRNLWEDVAENTEIGAAVGALFGALATPFGPRAAQARTPGAQRGAPGGASAGGPPPAGAAASPGPAGVGSGSPAGVPPIAPAQSAPGVPEGAVPGDVLLGPEGDQPAGPTPAAPAPDQPGGAPSAPSAPDDLGGQILYDGPPIDLRSPYEGATVEQVEAAGAEAARRMGLPAVGTEIDFTGPMGDTQQGTVLGYGVVQGLGTDQQEVDAHRMRIRMPDGTEVWPQVDRARPRARNVEGAPQAPQLPAGPVTYSDLMRITGRDEMAIARAMRRLTGQQGMVWQALDEAQRRQLRDMLAAQFPTAPSPQSTGLPQSPPSTGNAPAPKAERPGANRPPSVPAGGAPQPGVTLPKVELPGGEDTPTRFFARAKAVDEAVARDQVAPQPAAVAAHFGIPEAEARKLVDWVSLQPRSSITRYGDYPHRYRKTADRPGDRSGAEREANRQWLEQQAADLGVDAPADMSDVELEDIIMRAIAAKEAAEAAADEETQRLEQEARDLADRLSQEAPDADDIPFDPLPDTTEAQPGAGGVQPAGPGAPETDRDMGAPGAPRAGPDAGNAPAGAVGGAPQPAAGTVRGEPPGGERPSEPAGERPGGEPGGAAGGAERPPSAPAVDTGGERPVEEADKPARFSYSDYNDSVVTAAKAWLAAHPRLTIVIPTMLRSRQINSPDQIRATKNGEVQFVERYAKGGEPVWAYLTIEQVRAVAKQIGHRDSLAPEPTPPAADQDSAVSESSFMMLANRLLGALRKGTPITRQSLDQMAREVYGAPRAEGGWTPRDAYDALELAVNRRVLDLKGTPNATPEAAREALADLEALVAALPTQTVRTEEQVSHQQFSTPPAYAYVVARAAAIQQGERVLEPSAGTGSLVAQAVKAGASVTANEIAPRRAAALDTIARGDVRVTQVDAAQIHNLIDEADRPTVVLMNPPFSATAGRTDKRDLMVGAQHIDAALKALEPGGRLVAIVGRGMAMDSPTYRAWWGKIRTANVVRANIEVSGDVYKKYGTSFATRLLVIDKTRPTADQEAMREAQAAGLVGNVATLSDLLAKLEALRGTRTYPAESNAGQPGGAGAAPKPPGVGGRPGPAVPPATGGMGPGGRSARPGADAGGAAATDGRPDQPGAPDAGGGNAIPPGGPGQGGGAAGSSGATGKSGARGGERGGGGRGGARVDSGAVPAGDTKPAAGTGAVGYGDKNKVFTKDAAERARELIRKKLGQVSAGPDPELLMAGITLAGYHVEAGARSFADFTRAMLEDMGEIVRPYLRQWYNAVRDEPGFDATGMTPHAEMVDAPSLQDRKDQGLPPRNDLATPPPQPDVPSTDIGQDEGTPAKQGELSGDVYEPYQPQLVRANGAKRHPTDLVQSAAMASVTPPVPTYKPDLPDAVLDKGILSLPQYETLVYAGQAHEQDLPAADGEQATRRGMMIGDGTGVGKGRQISGVILDNFRRGRTRAIWISKNSRLIKDATRDWLALGGQAGDVLDIAKTKPGNAIKAARGIMFATYGTIKSKARNATLKTRVVGREAGLADYGLDSRIGQLVDWLGKDFDGVLAFDESHMMQSAVAIKGTRGIKKPSQIAMAGIELQRAFPRARVVYASATGATELTNLAYAERLGLWGRGTPFASVTDFLEQVSRGGIATMEMIARDMKAMGAYLARNLSFKGVEQDRVEHVLTPEQREIYDTMAEGWAVVLRDINAALEITASHQSPDGRAIVNPRAKSNAMSAFWSSSLRFWNQIVTAIKVPSLISAIERDVAEGRQAVVQLVNTDEAATGRAVEALEDDETYDDLDITPRDILIQMIQKSFPVQQHHAETDSLGNTTMVPSYSQKPVMGPDGKQARNPDGTPKFVEEPVLNREAVRMRDALIERISMIRVPNGALDQIIDHFGGDKVAEVTGRTARYIMAPDPKTGVVSRMEQKRSERVTLGEAAEFQDGKRRILIFSDAGGTGVSYHADNTKPSKDRRRSHYILQPGWIASNAVQGIGRTHRANQASAPLVRLVTTNLKGEKRFISSISRRIAQLGALTKGQREAAEQGMFSARDNLESTQARQALADLWRAIRNNEVPGISSTEFEEITGLKLVNSKGNPSDPPPITQFMNRLLALKIDMQNDVFSAFEDRWEAAIERARENGELDAGLETLKADKAVKLEDREVHRDERTGAATNYSRFKMSYRNHARDFAEVARWALRDPDFVRFVISPQAKRAYFVMKGIPRTDKKTGAVIGRYRLIATDQSTYEDVATVERWGEAKQDEARAQWEENARNMPEFRDEEVHLITGVLLPIWDQLPPFHPRVVRLQTDAGERFLGRVVPDYALDRVLENLGASASTQDKTPAGVAQAVLQGNGVAKLANGWLLRRRMIGGEARIQIEGPSTYSQVNQLKQDGVIVEIVSHRPLYFVPTGPMQERVLERILRDRPVSAVSRGATPSSMQRPRSKFHAAWHGSPHDFDRFDTAKIGTGEGAQVYGWGLYFAGRRGVAEYYRKALSSGDATVVDNTPADRQTGDHLDAVDFIKTTAFEGNHDTADDIISDLEAEIGSLQQGPEEENRFELAIAEKAVELLRSGAVTVRRARGKLYEVELAPKEEDYLDWDAPLAEQSPQVRKILADNWWAHPDAHAAMTGEQIYKTLARDLSPSASAGRSFTEKAASLALAKAGIPGIRYRDAGSRRATPETVRQAEGFVARYEERAQQIRQSIERSSGAIDRAKARGYDANDIEQLEATHNRLKDTLADTLQYLDNARSELEKERELLRNPTRNYVIFDAAHIEVRSKQQRPRIVPYGYPTRNGGWVEPVSWDANAWFYNTPANVAVREKAAREVGALIERILGSEQKVVVADLLEDAETENEVWGAALAQHERERTGQDADTGRVWREASGRVIDYLMAISTRSENVFRTARHEALHIARRLGIVTDAHWKTLAQAAKREGWIDKHEIRDLYPSATEDQMLEEAIAEEFAAWGESNGPEPNTALWRIWVRAVRFFRALRAWARDFLKRNPDARDLFQRLEDGLLRQAAGPERRVVNDAGDMMSQQRPWGGPVGMGTSKAEAEDLAEAMTRTTGRYYHAERAQRGGWAVTGGALEVNPELEVPDPPMERRLRELEASMEDEETGEIPPSRQAEYQRRVAEIKAEFGQGPKPAAPAAPAPNGPAQLELGGGTSPVSQREATERKMEAPGTRKQQEGRARNSIADLPLFDPNARKQGSLFQMPNPGRPGGNGANQLTQAAVVRGVIERPSAMDWLVRLPFHGLLGGVNERGEWRPGAAAMRLARHLKQSAKVPARFPGAAGINEFLERARIGLIDRYGLDEAYSARDRERQLEAARLMRQGTEHAQWLARQNITAAEARTLHKFLTGELVDNAEWTALFDRYGERAEAIRASVDAMGLEAVSLGLISRESYERNRGTYLHRVYQKYEAAAAGTPEAKVANRAKAARVRFMADEMKGRGLFFNVKVERILGTAREWWGDRKPADLRGAKLVLLERTRETDAPEVDVGQQPTRRVVDRVYWPAEEAIPDRYAGWNDRGTFEVRNVSHDGKDAVIWRDFTPEERERMGEILDARYTIAKTFHLLGQDLATGRFFRDVAANQDWARDSVEADTWINASDYNNWTGSTKGAQWVRVPDEEIPDTGGKKRWGALSGMYVRPEIWRDLHSTQLQMDRSSLMSWWQPILNQWKLNKTARSPVVHMNNVVSNLMLMDMHDIKFSTLVRAVRALAKGDHIYEAAVDAGVFEGGFASVEMRREVLEPLLREIQQQTLPSEAVIGPRGWSARVAFMGAYVNKLVNVAKALDAKMLALYQVEDNVFKLAAYMTRTRMGDDPVAAANYAREAFVDYDIRAPWVQAARKTLLPFISYTYRAVPMMAKLLATKPWKVAKYAGLLYGLNALAYLMWPGDEEAERAALRREAQGYLWALFAPIGYRMLRLWNDEYGRPMFLDLRNWVPGGNFLDSLQSHSVVPLFQWMQPGGPLMVAAELLLNHSAFTGEDIIKERTATAGERVTGIFDYIWKAWMPNAAWVPGSWAWDKVWSASQGVRDRLGRPYGFAEAVVSGMGIKLAPNDVGQGFQIQRNQIGHEIRELQIQLRAARMDWQRGALSQSAYQARVTDLNQRVAERRADLARIGALQQRVPASTRVPFQPDTGN